MYGTRRSTPPPTSIKPAAPKRTPSDYAKATAAVKAVAKQHGLTVSGWLKTHPQDPCRRTALKDKAGNMHGYGYASPGGSWWMTRGTKRNAPIFAQGDAATPESTPLSPITPVHTVLATAAVANRHEKGLALV